MVIGVSVSFCMSGKEFDPDRIQKDFGIELSNIRRKGEIGTIGRYKGLPMPSSGADIKNIVEEGYVDESEIYRIASIASRILMKIKKYHIEWTWFYVTYGYAAQCSLGFTKKDLKALSKLDGIAIDCVQEFDNAEIEGIDDFSDKVRLYNQGKLEKEIIMKYRNNRNGMYTKETLSVPHPLKISNSSK